MRKKLVVFVLAMVLGGSGHAKAAIVVQQLPDDPQTSLPLSNFNGVDPFRQADNFTLVSDEDIAIVGWWGAVFKGIGGFTTTDVTNVESFTIEFFEADGAEGRPGTSIQSETFLLGATNPTASGILAEGQDIFFFETTLSTPVSLSADHSYWLSITATIVDPGAPDFPEWTWASTTPGVYDTITAVDDVSTGPPWDLFFGNVFGDRDVAFQLEIEGTVAEVVALVPVGSFGAGGQKNATLRILEAVEQEILDGNIDEAITKLNNLRRRVDGCADNQGTAEPNDWIEDCTDQILIRNLIDNLITNLSM